MLCKLVVSLQMQNRKTTDNEISIVPNPSKYSIVAIADQRAVHQLTTNLQNPVTTKVIDITSDSPPVLQSFAGWLSFAK